VRRGDGKGKVLKEKKTSAGTRTKTRERERESAGRVGGGVKNERAHERADIRRCLKEGSLRKREETGK
jgi:hypothetical protein